MVTQPFKAQLYLNGVCVGHIESHGSSDSWGYGEFAPLDSFSRFAPYFGAWALLIHEDDDRQNMSREALEELRDAEVAIDSIRAELQWPDSSERTPLLQINIDGTMVEWKRG